LIRLSRPTHAHASADRFPATRGENARQAGLLLSSQTSTSEATSTNSIMNTRIASCSCGQLTATTTEDPIRVSICHCLACQRRTGSVFGAQARFRKDDVVIHGQSKQYGQSGTDHGYLLKTTAVCPRLFYVICPFVSIFILASVTLHALLRHAAQAQPSQSSAKRASSGVVRSIRSAAVLESWNRDPVQRISKKSLMSFF